MSLLSFPLHCFEEQREADTEIVYRKDINEL